jgi:hypothetical protein
MNMKIDYLTKAKAKEIFCVRFLSLIDRLYGFYDNMIQTVVDGVNEGIYELTETEADFIKLDVALAKIAKTENDLHKRPGRESQRHLTLKANGIILLQALGETKPECEFLYGE